MVVEIMKFVLFAVLIVVISKYILVKLLRKLAEALNLSAKTVGNVTGLATSVPELLTVSFSAFAGLGATSIYNIISSNVINLVQYVLAVILNKNQKQLSNQGIKIQLILVGFTILIPIFMVVAQIDIGMNFVPIFIFLFILFNYINSNVHKLYLKKQDKNIYKEIEEEKKWVKGKASIITKYSIYLTFTTIALYLIGNRLSIVLENLAQKFNISEFLIGITLGFITSIPELITFFESQKHYKNTQAQEGVIEATNNLLTSNVLNLFIIQTIGLIIINLV